MQHWRGVLTTQPKLIPVAMMFSSCYSNFSPRFALKRTRDFWNCHLKWSIKMNAPTITSFVFHQRLPDSPKQPQRLCWIYQVNLASTQLVILWQNSPSLSNIWPNVSLYNHKISHWLLDFLVFWYQVHLWATLCLTSFTTVAQWSQ